MRKATRGMNKFSLGQVVGTPGALKAIENAGQEPGFFLSKHAQGDWGTMDKDDKQLNEDALSNGDRILSAYRTLKGERIWIITEADRSTTALLLPDEY
ncbi:MAG: hypothetical protein ACYC35_00235 [Pirellulales bacterium]